MYLETNLSEIWLFVSLESAFALLLVMFQIRWRISMSAIQPHYWQQN